MIRIDSITVKGYKNINTQDLICDSFNVIVGPNNSGKTNFFEIISFLDFIINGSMDSVQNSFVERRSFKTFGPIVPHHDMSTDGTIEFLITFSNMEFNQIYNYSINLNWKRDKKSVYRQRFKIISEYLNFKIRGKTGKPTTIFNRKESRVDYGEQLSKTSIIAELPQHVSVLRVLKIVIEKSGNNIDYKRTIYSLNQLLKSPTFFFSNFELLKTEDTKRTEKYGFRTISYDVINEIISIKDSPKFNLLKGALNKILKITDTLVFEIPAFFIKKDEKEEDKSEREVEKDYVLMFEHFGQIKNIRQFSDGTIMLIAMITKIITSRNSIIFFEEPENSLHPKALLDLISFIRSFENEKQFFINTHSITLINKIDPENVIIAKCDKKGFSELSRIKDFKEMRKKLKQSFISFSDELFFGEEEFDEELEQA